MNDSTRCPSCAAAITSAAAKCPWCGTLLPQSTTVAATPVARGPSPNFDPTGLPRDFADVAPPARRRRGIGGIVFAVLLIGAVLFALTLVFSLRTDERGAVVSTESPNDPATPSNGTPPNGR